MSTEKPNVFLEYDNDPDDPSKPVRTAQSSAIFTFLRNRAQPRKAMMTYDEMPRKKVDYLGVALPETGDQEPLAKVAAAHPPVAASGRKSDDSHLGRACRVCAVVFCVEWFVDWARTDASGHRWRRRLYSNSTTRRDVPGAGDNHP